jgi:FKBP-type peptidyl-prolyl cis-trans isomerase SlyD
MSSSVIQFHYTVKDKAGKIIDSSENNEPLSFLTGVGQIIEGLEKALVGLAVGDKKSIEVEAHEAYGVYDQSLIHAIPKAQFPAEQIKIGDVFQMSTNHGVQMVTVVEFSETEVTIDANHPLAGKDLFFQIEVISKREATAEELSHGHAHGGDGHTHEH